MTSICMGRQLKVVTVGPQSQTGAACPFQIMVCTANSFEGAQWADNEALWNGECQEYIKVFPQLKWFESYEFSFGCKARLSHNCDDQGHIVALSLKVSQCYYVTLSDSAVLAADEECTQLKESWICTELSICFHFDPQNPHWKHKAPAKTIFEKSASEWMLQLTNTFSLFVTYRMEDYHCFTRLNLCSGAGSISQPKVIDEISAH